MSLPVPPIYQELERLRSEYLEEVNAILGGQDDRLTRADIGEEIVRMARDFAEEVEEIAAKL